MVKKHSKKKTNAKSNNSLESEVSLSESEVEENDFEESDINDSDLEDDSDDDEIASLKDEDEDLDEDLDNIDDNDSTNSVKDDNCFFTYNKDNETDLFDDDDYETETQSNELLNTDNRISIDRMSLYEFVRLIGTRTKQLSMGAKPMIKNHKGLSSKEIAILELKNDTMPLIIKRPLPDNRYEIWKINELYKDHLF